ncbi:47414463-0213-477c-850b-63ecb5d4a3a3-CDS [Sclerotinia trifoliorum]|uniref:47414463-0213-477c-850b-63ecb5d4a3a3-CDS n=1 Tax=Sclerotinia trifoliorum TaxID=28548 RepID=A0A8H2VXL1_9HELO|nr:47414463-0213-477c-850b-63ecb5d4a3a3-CDS [Sclerotinia trifoliorum]
MDRINRPFPESLSDEPQAPTAIDLQIGLQRGSTAALEVTPERWQATKQMPSSSTAQRIEELTKENGQLRLEIRYYQRMRDAMQALFDDTTFISERVDKTIKGFIKVQRGAENDWCNAQGEFD